MVNFILNFIIIINFIMNFIIKKYSCNFLDRLNAILKCGPTRNVNKELAGFMNTMCLTCISKAIVCR